MMTCVGLWDRLDVLVHPEQVGRSILVFQRHQARIAVAIRCAHPVAALVITQEVDIVAVLPRRKSYYANCCLIS